jgi:hypothetical protein
MAEQVGKSGGTLQDGASGASVSAPTAQLDRPNEQMAKINLTFAGVGQPGQRHVQMTSFHCHPLH